MKSYSLDNWDGKHSKSEQKTTHNPMGSSRTWENRSNKPASSSENVKARNDASKDGTKHSESISNQTASEVSSNFANELSNGIQRERMSPNMGLNFLKDVGSSVLTVPITPRKEVKNASNDGLSGTRTFLPVDSPSLRAFHAFNASTSNGDLAERLEAAISGTPLPRANKNVDVISLYSTDAEGEDENETDIVAETLLSFSPSNPRGRTHSAVRSPSPSEHNSLFTPPPSEGYPPLEGLFTPPPPSHKSLPAPKPNRVMSHVQVPRCPGPKSAYKWLSHHSAEKKKKAPKSKVSSGHVVHKDLATALQFAFDQNESLGVSPHKSAQKKKKKEEKQGTYEKPPNAIAGPSKPYISVGPASSAGKVHINEKKRVRDDESQDLKKKRKTNHVDIDLTLTDDEQCNPVKSKPNLPPPKPKPLLTRSGINDERLNPFLLALSAVKPLDPQIWSLNTRILRQNWRKSEPSYPSLWSNNQIHAKRRKEPGRVLPPWFQRSSDKSESDEISIGGPIPTSWDPGFNSSDDDDEPDLQPSQFEPPRFPPPLPTASTKSQGTSRKIDLAALYRQQEKPRVKTNPAKSSKSPNQSMLSPTKSVPSSNVGLVTPSHSVHGPLSKKSSIGLNDKDKEQKSVITTTPSAKALGKRRAVSPPPIQTPRHSERSYDDTHPGLNGTRALDIYIHDYIHSSPPFQASTNAFASGLALSSMYSPPTLPGILPAFRSESGNDTDPLGVTGLDSFGVEDDQVPFWSSLESSASEYQYLTVDPTLLGIPMDQEPSEPDYTDGFEHSDEEFEKVTDGPEHSDTDSGLEESGPVAGPSKIRQPPRLRSSPSIPSFLQNKHVPSVTSVSNVTERKERSPSLASSSLDLSEITPATSAIPVLRHDSPAARNKKHSPSAFEPDRSGSEYISSTPSLGRDTVVRHKPRRTSSTSFVDTLSDKEYATSTTSNVELAPSMKGKQRDRSVDKARFLPKRQRTQRHISDMVDVDAYLRSTDSVVVKDLKMPPLNPSTFPSATRNSQGWPTCDIPSYCHQCRRKTILLKMVCSSCQASFCFRCLTLRYPKEEFTETTNACPRCKKYCNCTGCCLKRREVYVSSHRPPGKRVQSPKVMPEGAKYFGTVYDLKGKRIAATYGESGDESGIPKVVFAQGPSKKLKLPTPKSGQRLFVGIVQKCWGLRKDVSVREIRPMARPKKAKKNGVLRKFVGNPDFVKYRIPLEPEGDDEDKACDGDYFYDGSSLTSLSTSEDEQEGHEQDKTSPPEVLETTTLPVP